MAESARVLSIQSHVVFGYVGNKSATFPLQVLGFDVDPINSVHFSNHTGFKIFKGQRLTDKELGDLVDGLALNKLDHYYTHLLTGYASSPSLLLRIAELIRHLKSINPNLIYVCDPVMGDNQKLYVSEEIVPIYKNIVIPLADIITPNQFELEILTGKKINSLKDAQDCINILHNKGPKTVVLSSFDLGIDNRLRGMASSKRGNVDEQLVIEFPKLPGSYTGTGDLFTALFLAWMYKTDNVLKESLEKTIATMQAVLKRTLDNSQDRGDYKKFLDLKLIQSKNDIENPKVEITAQTTNL